MNFKNLKFYVSIVTVIVMCFCLISCGANEQNNDSGNEGTTTTLPSYIPEETVTLTIYSDTSSYDGLLHGWFADIIKERYNVELNVLMSNNDVDINSYMGEYDIIMSATTSSDTLLKAMEEGYLLDLSSQDLDKYMPYVSKYLKDSYINYSNGNGKHIYGIHTRTTLSGDYNIAETPYTWDMNYDYYEEIGKPEISNIDDWVNVLEQIKISHPTTDSGDEIYGISYFNSWAADSENANDGMIFGIQNFVKAYYGYEQSGTGFYDWSTNKYYDTLAIDENGEYGPYLQMLKLNNELYKKGLLDPASETQSLEDVLPKIENGQILASLTNYTGNLCNTFMYPVMPKEANLLAYEIEKADWCIAIDSATKYPELCMTIIDYLYTPEAVLTSLYGPRGDCWDYDENGLTYLTNLGTTCLYDKDTLLNGKRFADGCPMYNVSMYNSSATNPDNGEAYNFEYWKSTINESANETEIAWRTWADASSIMNYMHGIKPYAVAPVIDITIDFSETELSEKYAEVSNIIVTKSWNAIKASTNEEFDKIVQDMITSATAAGYEELVTYSENYINKQIVSTK